MIQPSMGHFWEGLRTGKFIPKTDNEINEFIRNNHFSGQPISELSEEDRPAIENWVLKVSKCLTNDKDYARISCQNVIYMPVEARFRNEGKPCFIFEKSKYFNELKIQGQKPLTAKEKIELFSNPNIWYSATAEFHNLTTPLTSWGMRHLEAYGFSDEKFLEILERVRKNTGKTLLNLLDVGGAMGVMLNDAKTLDKNIITSNLTIDVPPVSYDFDKLYLCSAERFPIELKENVDLIFSNMAFLYMPGQALALENCLQSLSIGGEAFLDVHWGKQHVFVPNSAIKMQRQYARMQKLRDEGFIDLYVKSYGGEADALTFIPTQDNEEPDFFPSALVKIRKLKFLKD